MEIDLNELTDEELEVILNIRKRMKSPEEKAVVFKTINKEKKPKTKRIMSTNERIEKLKNIIHEIKVNDERSIPKLAKQQKLTLYGKDYHYIWSQLDEDTIRKVKNYRPKSGIYNDDEYEKNVRKGKEKIIYMIKKKPFIQNTGTGIIRSKVSDFSMDKEKYNMLLRAIDTVIKSNGTLKTDTLISLGIINHADEYQDFMAWYIEHRNTIWKDLKRKECLTIRNGFLEHK